MAPVSSCRSKHTTRLSRLGMQSAGTARLRSLHGSRVCRCRRRGVAQRTAHRSRRRSPSLLRGTARMLRRRATAHAGRATSPPRAPRPHHRHLVSVLYCAALVDQLALALSQLQLTALDDDDTLSSSDSDERGTQRAVDERGAHRAVMASSRQSGAPRLPVRRATDPRRRITSMSALLRACTRIPCPLPAPRPASTVTVSSASPPARRSQRRLQ